MESNTCTWCYNHSTCTDKRENSLKRDTLFIVYYPKHGWNRVSTVIIMLSIFSVLNYLWNKNTSLIRCPNDVHKSVVNKTMIIINWTVLNICTCSIYITCFSASDSLSSASCFNLSKCACLDCRASNYTIHTYTCMGVVMYYMYGCGHVLHVWVWSCITCMGVVMYYMYGCGHVLHV